MKGLMFLIIVLLTFATTAQHPFFEKYGTLETIAGTGAVGDKGENNWKRTYERKDPTTVELSRPHYVMADKEGNIYIADKDAHAIRKIDARNGRITTVAGTNEEGDGGEGNAEREALSYPNGLFVMPDGAFYILDLGNSKIRKVDTDGKTTTVCEDKQGIEYGRGLWVSSNEDTIIYASGTRLRIWTDGAEIRTYADGFDQLGNICFDLKGNLIVTDRDRGKVYRFNKKNRKVEHIAGNGKKDDDGDEALEVSLAGVRAVWATPDGGLLLGCHDSDDLWYMAEDDKIYKFIDGKKDKHSGDGEPFDSDGKKVSEIRSVSMDYEGNILICENDKGYIRKVNVRNQ